MRIGIDARKLQDFGIGSYVRGLLRAILDTSSVDVVALGSESVLLEEFGTRVMAAAFEAPLYSIRELVRAQRILEDAGGVDVLHSPHYTLPFVDVPGVVTIHDLIHLERRGVRYAHQRLYAGKMIQSTLRRAAAIITVSNATADALRRRFTLRSPLTVIPNGVDDAFRQPLSEEAVAATLQRLGVGPRPYFLYAGNDLPHKNLPRIIGAFEQSQGTHGLNLVLAGSARAERSTANLVRVGRVSRDELHALYRGATALLLISEQEGFGLPAAEAMTCGTPVIASDIAALREITSGAAVLADPLDVAAISAAMRQVAGDAVLRAELAARGEESSRRFDWKVAAATTLEVYGAAAGTQDG